MSKVNWKTFGLLKLMLVDMKQNNFTLLVRLIGSFSKCNAFQLLSVFEIIMISKLKWRQTRTHVQFVRCAGGFFLDSCQSDLYS